MSLGNNIRSYRETAKMTQQELANKLYVTPQAVSRWETNQVEPSIETLTIIAKIFAVSVDELINGKSLENSPIQQNVETPPVVVADKIGNCAHCLEPIYKSNYGGRLHKGRSGSDALLCKACLAKKEKNEKEHLLALNKKARINGFIYGGIVAAVVLFLGILVYTRGGLAPDAGNIISFILLIYASFAFIFNLAAKNNFIDDAFLKVFSWGFVKMPGVIFSLSLDGLLWLLTVKLFLAIIGFLLATLTAVLAVVVCLFLSMFVFPFALYNSRHRPEKYLHL